MIIHTPAPIAELTRIVGGTANVIAGTAIKTGGPDCFAGWHEPADRDDCVPNNLVETLSMEIAERVAQDLYDAGYQVVVCARDSAGNDVPIEDGTMPIRYQMAHAH